MLNNRPLTYIHDDCEGVSYALTLAELIYGRRVATSPSGRQSEITSTSKTLTKQAKHQYQVLNNFTKQWQRDCLLSLQESRPLKSTSRGSQQLKTGDIVVFRDDGTPRCLWKLVRVIELHT